MFKFFKKKEQSIEKLKEIVYEMAWRNGVIKHYINIEGLNDENIKKVNKYIAEMDNLASEAYKIKS